MLEYFEKPFENLQKNLSLFSVWFGSLFESMKPAIDLLNTSVDLMRKENVFNITFSDVSTTNIKTLNDDLVRYALNPV